LPGKLEDLQLPAQLTFELRNAAALGDEDGALVFFHGLAGTGKRAAAAAISSEMERPLLIVDMAQAQTAELTASTLLGLLRRETLLESANIYLAEPEAPVANNPGSNPLATAITNYLPPAGSLFFVGTGLPWPKEAAQFRSSHFTFDFPVPNHADRVSIWREAMNASGGRWSDDIEAEILAGKFVLTGGEIRAACLAAKISSSVRGAESISLKDIEAAARSQSNQGLRSLAQKIDRAAQWNDLILPPRALRQLREICATERHRHRVYTQWNFGNRVASGLGLNVLFHGASGTGKTMAAGIIASELGLDLYKIDLSTVISKYIGETEKQLGRIFREARSSNAILFFDEADALFGKRSEVKDAHDRYANIEVAYLLQKMEEYEGIVILATNFRKNMDEAFTRRMQHILEFPFPDAEHRERIWRKLLPAEAPVTPDVNFGFLARQFDLTGGNIRNVVLAAAFLAAAEERAIGMEHFILATARELQKLGKLPGRSEFREYYELLRAGE
jgi:SpoVK/Ycf46/Vps4 family AAA+-type ATPase